MNEKYEWEQNKPDSSCLTLIMVCAILFNIQSCDHEWNFYTFHPLDVETSFCGSVCEAHLWRDIKTAACLAESESRTASSSSWDSFRDASLAQLWDSYYTGSCTHAIFWWEEIFLRISARWLSNFLLLSQISVDKVLNPLKTIWNLIHCSLMKVITHWTWQMSVLDHDIRKYQSGPVWTDVRTLYGERVWTYWQAGLGLLSQQVRYCSASLAPALASTLESDPVWLVTRTLRAACTDTRWKIIKQTYLLLPSSAQQRYVVDTRNICIKNISALTGSES